MKTALALICFSLLLAGCTSARLKNMTPAKSAQQIMSEYRSIKRGMSEDEVIDRLGPPTEVDKTGKLHWRQEGEIVPDARNMHDHTETHDYCELMVNLNSSGVVTAAKAVMTVDQFPDLREITREDFGYPQDQSARSQTTGVFSP